MQAKKVSDSACETIFYPTSAMFNNNNSLHGGELFKLIDEIGGAAAMRHASANVVTASVSDLRYIIPIRPRELVLLKSSVQTVGRTSLEVGVRVEVENVITGTKKHAATCFLTYVAFDENDLPKEVPHLLIEGKIEEERKQKAEKRKKLRMIRK